MYALRIKARCLEQGHAVIELRSSQLFEDPDVVEAMMTQCGLSDGPRRGTEAGGPQTNKPAARQKRFDISVDRCARDLDAYLDRCARNGVEVPASFFI
jgi:hypothetical protein